MKDALKAAIVERSFAFESGDRCTSNLPNTPRSASARSDKGNGWSATAGVCVAAMSVFCLAVSESRSHGADLQERPPLELLKEFVASPPPIEDIVFSYSRPVNTGRTAADGGSDVFSTPVFFRARWQPDALFLLEVPQLGDVEPHPLERPFDISEGMAIARWQDAFWFFDAQQKSFTHWQGPVTVPLDTCNPVLLRYDRKAAPLFAYLSMGPHFVEPGSIRWIGDRFDYEAPLRGSVFRIRGEIFPGPDGRAERMTMHYKSHFADGHYLVRFYYGTNSALPFFLPERLHSVIFRDGREDPDKDIRILSLRFSQGAMPAEAFRPERWLADDSLSQFVYAHQSLYAVSPSGDWKLVERHQYPKPPLVLAHANRYYYVAVVLATAGFLILTVWMRKRQSVINLQQKQNA